MPSLHADHAGQNGAFPGVPIHVQWAEWELAHQPNHTILHWIEASGTTYRQANGDHHVEPGIRVIATPGTPAATNRSSSIPPMARPILAGQACGTVGESLGDPDALAGRDSAPDQPAYDGSIDRLRALRPVVGRFGHDRDAWHAGPAAAQTPAILPGPC